MRGIPGGAFALLALVALAPPLPAQQAPLAIGRWVRVVPAPGAPVHKGRLVLVLPDTVVLDDGRRIPQSVDYVPFGTGSEVQLPRHVHANVLRGAVMGAAIGAAVGPGAFALWDQFRCAMTECDVMAQFVSHSQAILLGGLIGLGAGAFIGMHVYTTEWDPVPRGQLDRLRTGAGKLPGRQLGVGASLSF